MPQTAFSNLLPQVIFETVRAEGFYPSGHLLALNSYENRVYEIGLEDHPPLVAKFYRLGRWNKEIIHDEHRFVRTLDEADVPVVSPLPLKNGIEGAETIGQIAGYSYALFPKFRGKEKDELFVEDRRWLGRTLARLHNVGENFKAAHRMQLTPQSYGYDSLEFILSRSFLPPDLKKNIETLLLLALRQVEPFFTPSLKIFPIHGDCHLGNVLWNKEGPWFVDFDDMVSAPPVQDVWMLFYGDADEKQVQIKNFFEGYETFRRFDSSTLILTEPLRTLRMIRHTAWIGQRYGETAFQRAFPYYPERRYWEEFLLSIKEQISLLQEM